MSSIRRLGLVAKAESPDALATAWELADWLRRRGLEVALERSLLEAEGVPAELAGAPVYEVAEEYDLLVVLGGDGSLLVAARTVGSRMPILGVNLGRLGFLTELRRHELYPSLLKVLSGEMGFQERALLDIELSRAEGPPQCYRILNDAVIHKSALSRIIELTLRLDGRVVSHFRADGLILSTPTGSTAYNLSAGGPIVDPGLPVVVVTPICPHTLSLRPLVVPDAGSLEVQLDTQREKVFLTLDGQEGVELRYRDVVRVHRSREKVRLIRVGERTFYDNLREKLRWGGLSGGGRSAP